MKQGVIFFILLLFSCTEELNQSNSQTKKKGVKDSIVVDTVIVEDYQPIDCIDTLEQKLLDYGLVDIQSLDSSILVDVKYASEDNFLGINLYGNLNRIYLQPDVARRLVKAQLKLKSIDSSKTLLVYDGVRPRSVQWKMWNSLRHLTVAERGKFVSNPRNGSLHNFGAAIDLTIADIKGNPLDMGAPYDHIGKIAYPSLEKIYLDSGLITTEHINNRKLLRTSMRAGGFWVIPTEWWHFNSCKRDSAWVKYKIVE
jgi:D-alanyl-D-alanine dipeptidase